MDTCFVCCDKFNKTISSKVICEIPSCNFQACKKCVRTYLLGCTNDPHCMQCKNKWSYEFLINNLNKSFVENDYKNHRKKLMVDQQISRTPELMNLVERTRKVDDHQKELDIMSEKFNEIRKQYLQMSKDISEKKNIIYKIKTGKSETDDRKKFIMPCSADNCKGYLSTQYKCEVCKLYTCPDCFEIVGYSKDDPHTCKDENIKSAELIKKETKGCPQCGVRIFKISGCDQMWCTECKVAFSWNTGKVVVDGNIHNPHYYQWMRDNNANAPRNPGDVVCGGLINVNQIYTMLRSLRYIKNVSLINKIASDDYIQNFIESNKLHYYVNDNSTKKSHFDINRFENILYDLHRIVNHITYVDLVTYRNRVRDLLNFDNYVVDYILNKKTRAELESSIIRNDNLRKKSSELLNIYELISVVGIERLNSVHAFYVSKISNIIANIDSSKNTKDIENVILFFRTIVTCITEFNKILKYSNDILVKLSYIYSMKVTITYFVKNTYISKSEKFTKNHVNTSSASASSSSSSASTSSHNQ